MGVMIVFEKLEYQPDYNVELFEGLKSMGTFSIPWRFLEISRFRNRVGDLYWEVEFSERGIKHVINQGYEYSDKTEIKIIY